VALFLGFGALAQAPREDGWVPLLNGKDLSGWKKNGDEKWIVEQGTILCESTAMHGAHIVTQLNGTKIVDFTDSSRKFVDGVIGLQIHTGGGVKVRWKDIYIQQH